ncbi:MAG: cyclic nucleotide-binding domain-containing protein [Pseudomonadota bacterium]
MSPLDRLFEDVRCRGATLDQGEQDRLRRTLHAVSSPAGTALLGQGQVADRWIFLTSGIAASEQCRADGSSSIARFFEAGQFCTNLSSILTGELAEDALIAITDCAGVAVPDRQFRQDYLDGAGFGRYLRLKVLDSYLFDKELICAKTSARTDARYDFLMRHHHAVLSMAPKKDIARFMGMTPQGLSRYLRSRAGPG